MPCYSDQPIVAAPISAPAAAVSAPVAAGAKASKAKDEEAGTRQRYKRQPKSRYSHHRNIKSNKQQQPSSS